MLQLILIIGVVEILNYISKKEDKLTNLIDNNSMKNLREDNFIINNFSDAEKIAEEIFEYYKKNNNQYDYFEEVSKIILIGGLLYAKKEILCDLNFYSLSTLFMDIDSSSYEEKKLFLLQILNYKEVFDNLKYNIYFTSYLKSIEDDFGDLIEACFGSLVLRLTRMMYMKRSFN